VYLGGIIFVSFYFLGDEPRMKIAITSELKIVQMASGTIVEKFEGMLSDHSKTRPAPLEKVDVNLSDEV